VIASLTLGALLKVMDISLAFEYVPANYKFQLREKKEND
jgi:hypothetical protein